MSNRTLLTLLLLCLILLVSSKVLVLILGMVSGMLLNNVITHYWRTLFDDTYKEELNN